MPWNFAYGSNMHPDRLRGRASCHPRRIERAVLRDWRLAFNLATGMGWAEPAMANIVPCPGSAVHGVALEIEEDELDRLIQSEGGSRFYRATEVSLTTYAGASLHAFAFVALEDVVRDEVPPSHRYLDLLREGARHHGLGEAYQAELDAHRSMAPAWFSPWIGRLFAALDDPRAHQFREAFMWLVHQGARREASRR